MPPDLPSQGHKKDGGVGWFIDNRKLTDVTRKDSYPLYITLKSVWTHLPGLLFSQP